MKLDKLTKNLAIVAAISIVLALITIYLQSPKGTLVADENQFSIADSGSVNKIVLQQKGKSIVLALDNGIWKVDNLYKVEDLFISNIKNLMYKSQMRKPVNKEILPQIEKLMLSEATECSFYNADQLLKKVKYVADSKDLVGLIDGFKNPYFIDFPLEGKVQIANLLVVDTQNWRSRTIFSSSLSTIESLKVSYFDSTMYNFKINRSTSKFLIEGMPQADSTKIMAYLDLYKNVAIRRFCSVDENFKKDSLLKIKPTFEIELKDKFNEKSNKITIYYALNQKSDIYGLVGLANDLCVIRPRVFEYLLQKRYFFESKK